MLHAGHHDVQKARFYVIDVHNHVNDAARIDDHMPPERVIEVMNNTNVKTIVILTGLWGDKLQAVMDEMVKPYPGRFMVFTQIDWSKIDDPNFADEMVAQIKDAVSRGARGLKLLKDLGLGVRDKSGKLIAVDDARLDPVWEECGRLGIPVLIHTGDPEAFFHPIDATNERYEELISHPDWSFYGRDYPSLEVADGGAKPGVRQASQNDVRFTPHGMAGKSRLGAGDARQVSECDGGVRSTRGGTRATAASHP